MTLTVCQGHLFVSYSESCAEGKEHRRWNGSVQIGKCKVIGRSTVTKDTLTDKFLKGKKLYENGDINASDFTRMMECSRTTLYKYMKVAGTENPAIRA